MSTDYGNIDSGAMPTRQKDPSSVQNLTLNWARELAGETISTSTWTTDGLTSAATSNTDSTATIRLSGGTEGVSYEVQNTITTSGSQTFRKKAVVLVREL